MVRPGAIGVLLALALAVCGGCHSQQAKNRRVSFSFANLSSNTVDSVELVWEGPPISAGTLAPQVYKTILRLTWPDVPKAKLRFVDDKTGQLHTIDLSFKRVNERVRTGKCRYVTLQILDFDRAEIICD